MTDIVSWIAGVGERGVVDIGHHVDPLWWEAVESKPSYPNWQRKRIQNPYSVSSNLTEGTGAQSHSCGPDLVCGRASRSNELTPIPIPRTSVYAYWDACG